LSNVPLIQIGGTKMKTTLIGLFSQAKQASSCIQDLERSGVNAQHLSMITSDKIDKDSFEITSNTKTPEAAGIGAAAGGSLGLVVGGLAAVGSVATGGLGLLASGPVVAAFTAGGFGAAGGGILGAVLGVAMPDTEQQAIIDELEKGGVLLCVECSEQEQKNVRKKLENHEAKKIKTLDREQLEKIKGH